jgi:hypothetical protein
MKMASGQSFATSSDALPALPAHHGAVVFARRQRGAGIDGPGMYGPAFIQHAQRLIQSAVENLARYDDLVEGEKTLDENLLDQLSLAMTPAQIEEAVQLFESDMQDVARISASAMKAVSLRADTVPRPCPSGGGTVSPSAWMNTLV